MIQLSFGINGTKSIDEYVELARLAEGYGFHMVSIFDDLMFKPAWPILYVLARETRSIRLGPSICNPYLTHPALLAGNAALLDEISDGRAYLGIGRGAFLDFLKAETPKPITAVRESIELVRRLWRGDRTPIEGQLFSATADAFLQWQPPRADIPIMVGTWGSKMCRMAGALADEVKAGSMWSAVYGQHMWTQIAAGAAEAGRDPAEVTLVFGPLASIDEDRQQAELHARRTLAFYLPYLTPMPQFVGVEADELARVQAAVAAGDYDGAARAISQNCLDNFALYGTPGDIIENIERMAEATEVGRIEFGMPHGPQGSKAALQLLGEKVVRHFA